MSRNKRGVRRASLLSSLLLIALVACAQSSPSTKTPVLSSDPVVRWIQQHALPLRTPAPGGSDADLAPLKPIVGTASIVGLGEETHGTHEFIEMKARLVEFLISDMGFTTLVMENDWGSSQLLDAYINGGPGDLQTIMTQALFGSWQTQEYEQLFAWLRAYNANPAHTAKIHFLGMDLQVFDQDDFDTVENYVQKVDPQQSRLVDNLYQPIIANGVESPPGTYYQLAAATKQQYQVQAQHVYTLLQSNQQRYSTASSPQQFALVLQNARIIVETATYLNAMPPRRLRLSLVSISAIPLWPKTWSGSTGTLPVLTPKSWSGHTMRISPTIRPMGPRTGETWEVSCEPTSIRATFPLVRRSTRERTGPIPSTHRTWCRPFLLRLRIPITTRLGKLVSRSTCLTCAPFHPVRWATGQRVTPSFSSMAWAAKICHLQSSSANGSM